MKEQLSNYRRERIASNGIGEATPPPPEYLIFEPPIHPYEASRTMHFEQRRRMRRITQTGKR